MKVEHLLIVLLLCTAVNLQAQDAFGSGGGDASSTGGSEAFSVGLVDYTELSGSGGSMVQGIQHAYEVYAVFVKKNLSGSGFSVFPNPTVVNLTLQTTGLIGENLLYHLSDIQGKILLNGNIRAPQTVLNTAALPVGIYFLKITQDDQLIQSFRVLKTN
jgi:hypothetical protein